jgi:hypothetical protein
MFYLCILSILLGMALGHRFKVFILVPAILTSALAIVSIGLVTGATFGTVFTAVVFFAISLQLGYLMGGAIRHTHLLLPQAAGHFSGKPAVRLVHVVHSDEARMRRRHIED